ncbi:hypothetical protein SULI_07595 [Saccharolobus solfataricus]|uniref:Methylenetetrahydrofolate reductase (NAD(P)H) n=3 Tax=Saccharolobus solfataricus TaxID=2287 RepID=Q97ZS8_SACS2|nr:hypothetical protein [Saccharolobus solfataricus]AAK40820.1 Conserved hypothetical protein [Saccharolobus solfataricus P2]AKA73794.1 hypothetical protein SULB_1526 [Saccharolobus solfataricus]AKA76491.1 hypothetical protein SULC_1524 [Saccharolobus solfataricus]AKA79184.1 hypothetical protein SULA_1525 [Saccharolobus solfataricus]AZF68270.1 hypothetical protein SULG_07595 [Saccharolobus solfataricus]
MQILVELHPKKKPEKLLNEIKILSSFDGFDIPDSPMGMPSPIPTFVASLIRYSLSLDRKTIIINQRLLDVNELFIRSLSITAKMLDAQIAFTKGDKPKYGKEVGYLSSDEAVNLAKEYGVKSGMMISLRKNENEIMARLDSNADFFLVLRMKDVDQIKYYGPKLIERAIPYLIVMTDKNRELVKSLDQPSFVENEIFSIINSLDSIGVKTVLISSLGDLSFFERLHARL